MITDLMTTLREIGDSIYALFVLPGQFVLSWLSEFAPTAAAQLTSISDSQAPPTLILLSLLIWSLLAFATAKLWLLLQNLFRIAAAARKALAFRISLAYAMLRKRALHRLRHFVPQRATGAVASPEVDIDDLDLAVLQSAAARGPGFTTSAPELAERLTCRPAQIQRSLNKLSRNKLLDGVIGSTDGFDNYRLSESGSHYVAMLRHKSGSP